jgi:MauM/NapG family ferredoxin protein
VAAGDREDAAEDRLGRRGFFSQGFRHLLRPLADIVEKRMEHFNVPELLGDEHNEPATTGPGSYGYAPPYPAGGAAEESPSAQRTYLRPPGALPEEEFLTRCTSSGKCVAACPVHAIWLVGSSDPREDHKPVIEASAQACVICDDLSCMKACPTGALQLVPKHEIRMGLAVLHADACLRTRGEDCQICVDKCPVGTSAIEIPYPGAPVTVRDACTGCGVCEMYCPTHPRAITVEPRT